LLVTLEGVNGKSWILMYSLEGNVWWHYMFKISIHELLFHLKGEDPMTYVWIRVMLVMALENGKMA